MEELTYDPVLDSGPLPKWRLGTPLRPPGPGRALVLVRDSGSPLTVLSGEEVPSSRFGAYQSVYTVDLTEHRLLLDVEPLLSRDPTFSFRGRVDLVCRVADPAEVVRRGIRDMSGALYGHLRRVLREVSRNYDIAEFHEAETALSAVLRDLRGDLAVQLREVHLELLVDEDEIAASGRSFRDVVRESRLDGMRRVRHLDLLREEGEAGLVAEIMEREGPRAALAWMEQRQADERSARLAAAELVLKRGDADREPFEQAELERAVIEDVLGSSPGLFGEELRRSRLKGALTAGRSAEAEPDAKPSAASADDPAGAGHGTLKGTVVPPWGADRGTRSEDRPPGAEHSGAAAADSAPPEDEPLPPPAAGRPAGGRGSSGRAAVRPGDPDRASRWGPGPAVPATGHDPATAGAPDGAPAARRESRIRGTAKRRPDDTREERR